MLTLISILIVYITILNTLLLIAFLIKRKNDYELDEELFEPASVIISFKNEKENIPFLIKALKEQTLDSKYFEVILIDDYSDDGSFEKALELTSGLTNIKVIKNKYTSGKKNSLKTGIEESRNDILIFTDADCIPHKDWLKSILKIFDYKTDIVYGYSPFIAQKSFVNLICRYENLFTSVLMTSFHNAEYPYMSFGRNFAYRKSLFNELGGFKLIEHSLSGDDDLFFQLAIKNGAKAKLIDQKNSVVFSKCKSDFKQYLKQKSRHISASRFYLQGIKLSLGIIYSANILLNLFIIPSLLLFDIFLITFVLLNWLIKISLIKIMTRKLEYYYPLLIIPAADFVYFLLLVFIGIRSRFRIESWK